MKSDKPEESEETIGEAAARLLGRLEAQQKNRASGRSEEPEQISNVIVFPSGLVPVPREENGPEAASAKQVRRATASGPSNRRQTWGGHRQRMGEW